MIRSKKAVSEARAGNWERSAGLSLLLRSALAGIFLLIAMASSRLLLTPYVDFFLVLGLLSALAVIDQAAKAFPLNKSRLAPGLVMSMIAVLMLFHQ